MCNYDTHYQSQAPSLYADRVCTPLTECNYEDGWGEYETVAPTETSNRECADILSAAYGSPGYGPVNAALLLEDFSTALAPPHVPPRKPNM